MIGLPLKLLLKLLIAFRGLGLIDQGIANSNHKFGSSAFSSALLDSLSKKTILAQVLRENTLLSALSANIPLRPGSTHLMVLTT
jgi:hypothetical protein